LPNAFDKRRKINIKRKKIYFFGYYLRFYLVIVERVNDKSHAGIANTER
jgi:hypothetical protein